MTEQHDPICNICGERHNSFDFCRKDSLEAVAAEGGNAMRTTPRMRTTEWADFDRFRALYAEWSELHRARGLYLPAEPLTDDNALTIILFRALRTIEEDVAIAKSWGKERLAAKMKADNERSKK